MILEKLHRAINSFNKAFNWRRFRRDALHLGESMLVFGVLYGIFSTAIWGVCWLTKINYDSGHNLILTEFYISHKKWHEVQQQVPYSVQHLKYLRNVALAQLGRGLERLPGCAALLSRALNTREDKPRADAWAEGDILL